MQNSHSGIQETIYVNWHKIKKEPIGKGNLFDFYQQKNNDILEDSENFEEIFGVMF